MTGEGAVEDVGVEVLESDDATCGFEDVGAFGSVGETWIGFKPGQSFVLPVPTVRLGACGLL